MSALKGKVFDRWRQFETFSPELQAATKKLSEELGATSAKLFHKQKVSLFKTETGVKAQELLDTITQKDAQQTPEQVAKLFDGLVLSGFVTPLQETDAVEEFAKKAEVFVPVPVATEENKAKSNTSVWSVRDGAIQAGFLKRKAGSAVLGIGGGIKEQYVVANDKTKKVYVFDSDVARHVVEEFSVQDASVQFDDSLEFGVKLFNSKKAEVFGTPTKELQDEWLNSFINAGATYREAFNLDVEKVKSFYELKDYDMQKNEVSMEKYKGKVILVVNVSSKCGLTPTNYPELSQLDEKYREQGLQILAFPCNQFASQEPGSHEEIMEFVKQYNCQFPFFEKADVNGAKARPVFTYLKAKLPGSFGDFVKWNFTKFLIDRNGQPYKRFAPKDLPFSFEDEIKKLLDQKAGEGEKETAEVTKEEAKKEEDEDKKTEEDKKE